MKEILRGTFSGVIATAVTVGTYIPLQTTIGVSLVLGVVTFVASYIIFPKEIGLSEFAEELEAIASRKDLPKRLSEAFEKFRSEEGLQQLEDLRKVEATFLSLVQEKFSVKGMTLQSFTEATEKLRDRTLDRMVAIIGFHRMIEGVNVSRLRAKLESLPKDNEQIASIKEHLGHYESAQDKISYLHGDIEKSLTAISALSLQVANIEIGEDIEVKFNTILEEVRRIAKDAAQFKKEI